MKFERNQGSIGQAFLGGHAVVVSARQGVVIKGKGINCPGRSTYKAILEPSQTGGPPSVITVPLCFVKVERGRFHATLYNETDEDLLVPESTLLGALHLRSLLPKHVESKSEGEVHVPVKSSKVAVVDQPDSVVVGSQLTADQKSKVANPSPETPGSILN